MANYNSAYTGAQIDAAVGAVASKANDSDVVHNTGDETVAGVKTFLSFPVTPSSAPTTDYQVVNKKYVDDKVKTDVPVDAKFTDTTYSEITTSEIDAGTASTLRTITGRRIKYILDKVQAWLDNKVDKVSGKGLSSNDYTTAEKNKLAGIEAGANNYTHPATHPASMIEESSSRRFVSDTEKAAWSAKQDALGYTPVPNTRKVNGKALSSDITLDAADIGAVPNDVFEVISGSLDRVGDIKTTVRTDLGDDWLLCNGEAVSETLYPELYTLLPMNLDGNWTSNKQGSTRLYGVAYGNGYWVAVGGSGTLYYKAGAPNGTWTANNQGSIGLYGVTYVNGYWVAVGIGGTMYYKAGTPDGNWTLNTQGGSSLNGIAYGNGYWVAVGADGTLYYKAGTPHGTWTANNHGSNILRGVAYGNGYWVAVGDSGTMYYKAGTPDGAWTFNKHGSTTLYGVAYGNGYWVAVGDSGTLYYKAGAPSGTWTSNKQGSNMLWGVTYGNGYWVAVGDSGTMYYKAGTPDGNWTSNKQGSDSLRGVACSSNYWVAVGDDGTLKYRIVKTLPRLTEEGAYVYIRAK